MPSGKANVAVDDPKRSGSGLEPKNIGVFQLRVKNETTEGRFS
jgi:hypothetical protein